MRESNNSGQMGLGIISIKVCSSLPSDAKEFIPALRTKLAYVDAAENALEMKKQDEPENDE